MVQRWPGLHFIFFFFLLISPIFMPFDGCTAEGGVTFSNTIIDPANAEEDADIVFHTLGDDIEFDGPKQK